VTNPRRVPIPDPYTGQIEELPVPQGPPPDDPYLHPFKIGDGIEVWIAFTDDGPEHEGKKRRRK
jgi:hypothetical protein